MNSSTDTYSTEIQSRIAEVRNNLAAQLAAVDDFFDLQLNFLDEQFELDRRALDQAFQTEKASIIKGALDELKEQRESLHQQFNNVSLTYQGDVLDVQKTRCHNLRRRQRNLSSAPLANNTRNVSTFNNPGNLKSNSRSNNSSASTRPLVHDSNSSHTTSGHAGSHHISEHQAHIKDTSEILLPAVGGLAVPLLTNEESTSQKQRQFFFAGVPLAGSERQLPMQMVATAIGTSSSTGHTINSNGIGEYHIDLQNHHNNNNHHHHSTTTTTSNTSSSRIEERLESMTRSIIIPENPSHLNTMLTSHDIQHDIESLKRGDSGRPNENQSRSQTSTMERVWVDSDRLYCGQQCFTRGDDIFLCQKDANRISAIISAISQRDLTFRRLSDRACVKVPLQYVRNGRYTIKLRRERNSFLKKS